MKTGILIGAACTLFGWLIRGLVERKRARDAFADTYQIGFHDAMKLLSFVTIKPVGLRAIAEPCGWCGAKSGEPCSASGLAMRTTHAVVVRRSN